MAFDGDRQTPDRERASERASEDDELNFLLPMINMRRSHRYCRQRARAHLSTSSLVKGLPFYCHLCVCVAVCPFFEVVPSFCVMCYMRHAPMVCVRVASTRTQNTAANVANVRKCRAHSVRQRQPAQPATQQSQPVEPGAASAMFLLLPPARPANNDDICVDNDGEI